MTSSSSIKVMQSTSCICGRCFRGWEKGIKCHPKKLRCAVKDVSYLRHLVVPNGTAPHDVKVEAITKMVALTDVSKLRALLGT
jgi:hypothetical protein